MMMKQFTSRSSEIGVTNICVNVILPLLLAFLLILPCIDAIAEENTENMQHYKYEDFIKHLGFREEYDTASAISHTISIADYRALNISVRSLLQAFPCIVADREVAANTWAERYVAYNLDDGSRLFVFINNNVITNACRMESRCAADKFSKIKRGVSSLCDVAATDKNTAFNPFIQWGPVSYHCLGDGTFYMIKYKQSPYSPEEFVVDDVLEISKDECLSILGVILPEDMP